MSGDLQQSIEDVRKRFEQERAALRDPAELEGLRTRYLGRKQGAVTLAFKQLATASKEERPALGQALNALKTGIEQALEDTARSLATRDEAEVELDLSLPGRRPSHGFRHPIGLINQTIERIFDELGYEVALGPEVDDDFHNFEALNIPRDHPARDMQDTLYVGDDLVLRTHTSNVQIRVMEKRRPPIRIIAPGRVYRRDTPDLSHSPVFHQVEGLVVDEGIHFGHLKATLDHFSKRLFGPETRTRLRPSYFPFTEPSAELDISCPSCREQGCGVCKQTGWLELLGCGMVDPNVLEIMDIDAERYTGFAFGLGLERAAMMRYGIGNIRLLFENDLRFLGQFGEAS